MRIFLPIIIIATLVACQAQMSPEEAEAAEREAARAAAKVALQLQQAANERFDICLDETESEGMSHSAAVTFCSSRECMRYHRAVERLYETKAYARRMQANSRASQRSESGIGALGEGFAAAIASRRARRDQAKLENSMMVVAKYCEVAGIQM